jgi:NAD-dependent SIR2 family protein deacetylase
MHGRAYSGPIRSSTKPKVLWKSSSKPRKDHDAASWLTATEFIDRDDVLRAKVAQLAALMRVSRHTVVYTGAGISASVVGQAALSGTNKVGWTGCKTAAMPTATHHALAALGRAGLIHGWVQQNHDGLPQKAGFPQERICEVHGSWFDPSNPVVKYSGSLKDHECEWMQREAAVADLVLVLGTSLGGLFADEVATSCAERSVAGGALGSAIINLQQTEQDGKMSLNLFSKSDDAMRLLLQALGLPALPAKPEPPLAWAKLDCALVPCGTAGTFCDFSAALGAGGGAGGGAGAGGWA